MARGGREKSAFFEQWATFSVVSLKFRSHAQFAVGPEAVGGVLGIGNLPGPTCRYLNLVFRSVDPQHPKTTGDYTRVHQFPQSGSDVHDDLDARLVVLGVDFPYSREGASLAELSAIEILETRGNAPRLYRNPLVFLVVDKTKLQDLDEATRRFFAWESIVTEKDTLDLSPHQVKQAETQKDSANGAVNARIPEAYQWLLVPVQTSPQSEVQWQATRLSGSEPLAVRASKKLRSDELLLTGFAPTRLRMELDRVPFSSFFKQRSRAGRFVVAPDRPSSLKTVLHPAFRRAAEKNSVCVYSQLKVCSSSEVAAMIEGVLRHDTEMDVEMQYVDSHGQSEVGFAFCHLLGFKLLPRLPRVLSRRLCAEA